MGRSRQDSFLKAWKSIKRFPREAHHFTLGFIESL